MTGTVSVGEQQSVVKLDPRTKLYILLIFSFITFSSNMDGAKGILKIVFAVFAFFMLLNIKKPVMAVGYAIVYLMAYNITIFLQYVSSMSLLGILVRICIPVVLRMMPGLVVAASFLRTTKVSEFITAMEKMHVSQKITIPFAVMFRFFPTIADEYRSIQDAMKMREINLRYGLVAMVEYRLVPIIVSIVKIGDELSAAAVTRGLGGKNKRTNYCQIGFGVWDIVLLVFMTLSILIFVLF